jgi:hypothetical protein
LAGIFWVRAGGREARRNRPAGTTTPNPGSPNIPLATLAAAADADGEEASRLHQPRKRPSLTPLPSRPPRSFGFRFRLSLAASAIWQDEKYAIRGEKYQGQQYSHIYFTRLHHMRNLLHALVPSWKPQLPGLCPRSPPLSFVPIPVNLVDNKFKSFLRYALVPNVLIMLRILQNFLPAQLACNCNWYCKIYVTLSSD